MARRRTLVGFPICEPEEAGRPADHPVLRSVEPGETWSWCVVDAVMFTLRSAEPG